MKKAIQKTIKCLALGLIIFSELPIAYATEIQKSIEQSQAEKYYQETIKD